MLCNPITWYCHVVNYLYLHRRNLCLLLKTIPCIRKAVSLFENVCCFQYKGVSVGLLFHSSVLLRTYIAGYLFTCTLCIMFCGLSVASLLGRKETSASKRMIIRHIINEPSVDYSVDGITDPAVDRSRTAAIRPAINPEELGSIVLQPPKAAVIASSSRAPRYVPGMSSDIDNHPSSRPPLPPPASTEAFSL